MIPHFSNINGLKNFLDDKVDRYNKLGFIELDPISIPHSFSKKEDIEISAFLASILSWGQRTTIIKKCIDLLQRMDNAPHQFITNHKPTDLIPLESFCHRTFNGTDTLYFIEFLKWSYLNFNSLENTFFSAQGELVGSVEGGLNLFRKRFVEHEDFPKRTGKHISAPNKKSACKRLNMFLRWMVRKDGNGVDFGIWNSISPAQLICPCDVHVDRSARKLGLIQRKGVDWLTAVELTENLKMLDPTDPVKYDFALFGMGVEKFFGTE